MTLTLRPIPHIPMIQPGDNLAEILLRALDAMPQPLEDGDILVLAQKIISKAEGRLVNLAQVEPSAEALELAGSTEKDPRLLELILRESSAVLRVRPGTIIVEHRLGFICANAGIDHSNVRGPWGSPEDWVLLLPEDPDASARQIQEAIAVHRGVQVGILIIDSHGRAWRNGTVGVCIGLASVPGVIDMRGEKDLFGYQLKVTTVAAADELAAAASLVMGQAGECLPAVHVRGFPYPLRTAQFQELIRPKELDLFR
jgi:coenzyme F420-0:L-glutamate ligase / coenzyme F420-1:gamma-L-glutamate ligase